MLIEKRQISWRSCFNILTQRYVTEESEEIEQFSLKNKTTESNAAALSFS